MDELVMVISELNQTMNSMNDNILEVVNKLDTIADQLSELQEHIEHQDGVYNIDDIFVSLSSIEDDVSTIKFNMD